MKKVTYALIFVLVSTAPALAQEKASTSFGEDFLKAWERHKVFTLRLAEAMPEANYGYKPADSVRSFAEIVLHVAGANYMFSSVAMEREAPYGSEDFGTEGKTKSQMIEMLSKSFDYAKQQVLNITAARLKKETPWRNPIEPKTTRSFAEVLHVMREHAAHHRGQMGVYLRLNGIKPTGYID